MRKSRFVAKVCIIALFLCASFTSCKNFFSGEDFAEELKSALDYASSPSFTIRFSDVGGKISPSGDYSVKVTDDITLIFTPGDGNYFLNWQVYSGETLLSPEETANYIHFDDLENPETKIKIINRADNLKIQANTALRPQIVSATPLYDTEGVYRDRRITVMFDQNITRDSIYFTKDELIKEGVWDTAKDTVKSGYKLLDTNGDKKYFGYQKIDDDNSIVWKILKITKRTDKNANLLKCYERPELDAYDSSVLRISAKSALKEMPPVNTDILVSINTAFGVAVKLNSGNTKIVSLSTSYAWTFFTNSKYDNEPPKITELALYNVKPGDKKFEDQVSENTVLFKLEDVNGNGVLKDQIDLKTKVQNSANIATYNLAEGKMWIKARVTDGGSGPKSLSASVTKVASTFYPCSKETLIEDVVYSARLSMAGPNGDTFCDDDCNGEFFDVSALDEGVYRMVFTATDKNDLTETREAYFVYDKTGPGLLNANLISNSRTKVSEETLKWSSNPSGSGNTDFSHVEVECWDGETKIGDTKSQVSLGSKTVTMESLTEKKPYEYRFYSVDYAGNRSESYTSWKDTKVSNPKITSSSRTSQTTETVYFNNLDSDLETITLECWDSREKRKISTASTINVSNISYTFTGLSLWHQYEYRLSCKDFAGHESSISSYKNDAKPGVPTNVYLGGINKGVRLFFTAPNDVDFYQVEITGEATENYSTKGDRFDKKYTGKTNGYSYTYYLQSVDYAGNKSDVITVSEAAGIKPGYYCYCYNNKDIYFSKSIKNNGQNLVGIVVANENYSDKYITDSTVRIFGIALDQQQLNVYTNTSMGVTETGMDNNKKDGLTFYNTVIQQKAARLADFPMHKYLYQTKNNYNNNAIIWYLPSLYEVLYFNGYNDFDGSDAQQDLINTSLGKIPTSVPHMTYLGKGMLGGNCEFVSCTFQNINNKVVGATVYCGDKESFYEFIVKDFDKLKTKSLLMAQINPAY